MATDRKQNRKQHFAKKQARRVPSEADILRNEQQRYSELARLHASDHPVFEGVLAQVKRGRPVTSSQAAQMGRIAAQNGWKVPTARKGKHK